MKILGIDPGTIKLGWGLIYYHDGTFIDKTLCGVVSAPQAWRRSQRLFHIFTHLGQVMDEHEPDVVVVETPFVGRNPQAALAIGQALGAVVILAEMRSIRLAYFSPAEIKRAAAGHGHAGKAQVAEFVKAILGLDSLVGTLDATDALAVAICYANRRDEAAILQRVDRP